MKWFKLFLICLGALFSVSVVSAVLNDATLYYSLDDTDLTGSNPDDISGNGNNGVNTGSVTTGALGILNQGFSFDGTNLVTTTINPTGSFTASVWFKLNSSATFRTVLSDENGQTDGWKLIFYNDDSLRLSTSTGTRTVTTLSGSYTDNAYHQAIVTFDGSRWQVFIDNTIRLNNTQSMTTPTSTFSVSGGDTNEFLGSLDEAAVYNRVLTSSERTTSYNGGVGFNPYEFQPPIITFDNVTINDITNFNNTFYNVSPVLLEVNLSTTNTNNNTNVTFFMYNSTNDLINTTQFMTNTLNGFLNITFPYEDTFKFVLNASNNETNTINPVAGNYTISYDITPPIINNNILAEYNDYTIPGFNSSCSNIAGGFCNISINSQNVLLNTTTFTFTLNGNITYNITTSDLAGNTVIESGLTLINPYQTFNFENSTGSPLTGLTFGGRSDNNTGTVQYLTYGDGLVFGNNTLDFEKFGYITQSITFEINDTADINNTYTISEAEIVVTIYDRESGAIVSGPNFQLEFISTVGLVVNTTTGTKTITNTLFQAGDYELRVTNQNFTAESVFFTFDNQESLPISVFTTNLSEIHLGIVDVKVVDKFGKSIVGAFVDALQWDSGSSSYITVSQGETAEDGKSLLNIVLDSKQYIFRATFGDLTKNTTPQFIPTLLNGKEIVISLDLGPTEYEGFLENINYNIDETFNGSVSNITLTWDTTDGTDVEGCIKYYRVQPSGTQTEISNDCSTGSSNILKVSKQLNSSYYIHAEVGFVISSLFYNQRTFKYPPTFDISKILEETNLALFVLPLLYLVVVLVGMANVFIGAVLLLLVNGMGLWLVPQFITPAVVAFFYFIGIVLMMLGSKRK